MRKPRRYKLRDDLYIQSRTFAGELKYVVKDPLRLEYCTIDSVSHALLMLCDGRRDIGDLVEAARRLFPGMGLDIATLSGFYENYAKAHFFEDNWETNILLIEKRRQSRAQAFRKATQNILEIHIPAWNPDAFFERIVRPLGFLFTMKALVVYLLIFLSAVVIMVARADEFALPLSELYVIQGKAVLGIVVLWFILLLSTLLHEIGHGLTCKHFGGGVYKIGVLILYFNPCLFCDVTESYFFANKRHKHAVTLAGGLVDLIVAALATYYWALTSSDMFSNQVAHRLAIFCGVSGLLVNFNPLLKYDGYFLLSDQLEIPNLRGDAFRFLGNQVRRTLGLPHDDEVVTPREKKIFTAYGLLAVLYSAFVLWLVYTTVSGWLIQNYRALGWILAAFILFLFVGKYVRSLARFGRFLVMERASDIRRRRWLLAGLGGLALGLFVLFPWPRHVQRPGVFEAGEVEVVRSELTGVIGAVPFREGDDLVAGTRPVVITADEARLQRERSRHTGRAAEARRDAALVSFDPGGAAADAALAAGWAERGSWEERRLSRAEPVLALGGTILTPHVERLEGAACAPGDTLFEVGDLSHLRVEVRLDERWLGLIRSGAEVEVRPTGRPGVLRRGRVTQVSEAPVERGFRQVYRVTLSVPNDDRLLRPGMTAVVRIHAGHASLVQQAFEGLFRALKIEFWV